MLYKYSAYTSTGKIVKSKIEADSTDKVKLYLLENNLVPVDITEAIDIKSSLFVFSYSHRQKVLIYFLNQLLFYLNSGFTIDRALVQVQRSIKFGSFKSLLNGVIESIKSGKSFSESLIMLDKKEYFNDFVINIIKAGELSGTLPDSIRTILKYLKRNYKIYNKILTSMLYPVFVVSLSVMVIFVLMIFVIPSITQLFEKSKIELPLMTQIVIILSNIILKYHYVCIFVCIASIVIFFKYIKPSRFFYKFWSFVSLHLPVYKQIYLNNIIVKFANAFSVLLSNGVDILTALHVSNSVIKNYFYDMSFKKIINKIREGEKVNVNFKKHLLFNDMFNSSVEVGENSGRLAEVIDETALFFEEELNEQLERFVTIIEPLLILVLGLIVGFLIFSILLPIFKISKIMKGGV